ncbi:minor capsid protein [Priestia megaterium]|uniref:phage minor capsid protein n=1 Tax=Priestia megaterium TaxID=1404 RepID=UPI000BFDB5E9|nr:phage minor capsid protein [Priestia megaterium]PGN53917.1 minor capsid protein [Priestia megaterium]
MRELPPPNYEYEISKLVNAYKQAMLDIQRELQRMDLNDFQRATANATLKSIADILAQLDETTSAWIQTNVPVAVNDGIVRSIIALELVNTVAEAENIVKFSRLNSDLVKAVVADTQDDLLQVTQNVNRKVRTTIRQVTAEVLRANTAKGINGTSALTSDLVANLRKQLGSAVETGIIDASRRRWKPEVYVETVVQTKMLHAHKEATINDGISRGANYGVISSHGAKDACRNWEGKIVKLTPAAEGDYPYIGALPNREIFHPRCKHVVSPVKRPDRV